MLDEEDAQGVEMSDLGTTRPEAEDAGNVPIRSLSERGRNRFVWLVISCFVLAVSVFAVTKIYGGSSFVDSLGLSFDQGSGEVGEDANNAETQEMINEEIEEELAEEEGEVSNPSVGKGSHPFGGKNGKGKRSDWWGNSQRPHNAGTGKEWVRNSTYWLQHTDQVPPELVERMKKYNWNRTKGGIQGVHQIGDGMCQRQNGKFKGRSFKCPTPVGNGMCKLANGKLIPCPKGLQNGEGGVGGVSVGRGKNAMWGQKGGKGIHPIGNGLCQVRNGKTVPCPPGYQGEKGGWNTTKAPIKEGQTTEVTKDKGGNNKAKKEVEIAKGNKKKQKDYKVTLADGKKFEVLAQLPHDKTSFTQGLTYANGMLYESTGLNGHSKVRQLDPDSGEVIKSIDMEAKFFGEGLTYFDDGKLCQITWKKQQGYIYDADTLDVIDEFTFSTTKNEGWGITFDPTDRTFIVSDGSKYLHFWSADNPGEENKPKVEVTRQNGAGAKNINELEFVNGKIIANVWYEDVLLVIDPDTGVCEMEYDLSMLWPKSERSYHADVLNGISISDEEGVLFITGKLWDRMYKVKLEGMDSTEESG